MTSPTARENIKAAEDVRGELADALKAAGIQLPSLRLDVASYASPASLGLIDLGRCNLPTARALAAALRRSGGTGAKR